jgi:hypothetical protein
MSDLSEIPCNTYEHNAVWAFVSQKSGQGRSYIPYGHKLNYTIRVP